ncbi:zinc ABC transporter substrate-binding protein [Saccharopolyspora sp. K220]|uniref:metal ABC transporter solute-binding protein, Zn/Mn family n=1 Tax=Saccharopolyspora soli TaxID=2926618 RepID=UPI001F5981C1|nr:zinc ABC transporter substrate-binding protein [Saccharopolyspora soli]MCI2419798.1 zinc ABC transporter substrate-binding protein [Saccharopolyspora soli]
MTFREDRRSKVVATAASLSAAALALAGCGPVRAQPGADDDTITVVTSTNVWASVVAEVGGSAVDVQPLISNPIVNPHAYESVPEDAAKVANADLVVFNGAGYDGFVEKILAAEPREAPTVEAAAFGRTPPSPAPEAEEGHGHSHDHSINEHFWYDFHAVDSVAERVATELGRLQPAKASEFAANAERFQVQVGQLDDRARQIAAARQGAEVVATEPVAFYLIEESGLNDITPDSFVDAVEAENDPPAAAIAEIQDALDTRRATALVFNPQTESPVTAQLRVHAEQTGIPVVSMTETLPAGQSYVQWMDAQVAALGGAEGLK